MSDLLKQSAEAYQRLSAFRYKFLLGRKGQSYELTIEFPASAFWHLAGLHKLRIEAIQIKKHALQAVLEGKVKPVQTVNPDILTRWQGICNLQELIESNNAVFRYRKHEFYGSNIRAEYLMTDLHTMFFIDENNPVSIFTPTSDQIQQVNKCPKLSTLKIVREKIATGESSLLYISPSYQKSIN